MLERRNLQSEFAAALLDSERSPPPAVTSHTAVVPIRRFGVYRNNVFSSLTDVLEAYFPVVLRLVGRDFFSAMAREFIRSSPPKSPIISSYGIGFPDFISTFEPAADVPYLADVARLELMRQRAYHAADQAPLKAVDLAVIPPEDGSSLVLILHPSFHLLVSAFPVVSIWRTNTFDDEVRAIDCASGKEQALVVRPELRVVVAELPGPSAEFIRHVMRGRTIGEAAEMGGPRLDLVGTLATLIDVGGITGFRIDGTAHSHSSTRSAS
jgi:hypothetical protein